jgi:hypothetical protein
MLPPRRVDFLPGVVNVISGGSRTGKSAIIPIIDYCLGADKCTIPVTTIRDATEWFGILIKTDQGEKLFARREPGAQRSTNDMFVLEADEVVLPDRIKDKNATAESLKTQLDDLAGLTSLDFDIEASGSGFKGRPSFRDTVAFCFQPQSIVANPNTLFYKSESYEHREKLRIIFPYVLGAVTPALLAKQHELSDIRQALRRKLQELANIRDVSQKFVAQMKSDLNRAMEFGFISQVEIEVADQTTGLQLLRKVVRENQNQLKMATTGSTIGSSADELVELRETEAQTSSKLAQLRQRFLEMTELRRNAGEYRTALHLQRDRLGIAEWLRKKSDLDRDCPVCGNHMSQQEEQLEELLKSLESIENAATQFEVVPASFDREYQRVRRELDLVTESLSGTQLRLRELRDLSENQRKRQYTELSASRFVGRLEANLRVLESVGQDSELQNEIDKLQKMVSELEREVDSRAIRERLTRALANVSSIAARYLPQLDAERPYDAVDMSINDLTVKVRSVDREDYLWEIGSGSNWLSYHLAMTLALQLFFIAMGDSAVPSLLIYDQPSQVYFPQRVTLKDDQPDEPEFTDEDVVAVRKVFAALQNATIESKKALQVIVLDHAAEDVWGSVPGVHLVEEWRSGEKLVPMNWLV